MRKGPHADSHSIQPPEADASRSGMAGGAPSGRGMVAGPFRRRAVSRGIIRRSPVAGRRGAGALRGAWAPRTGSSVSAGFASVGQRARAPRGAAAARSGHCRLPGRVPARRGRSPRPAARHERFCFSAASPPLCVNIIVSFQPLRSVCFAICATCGSNLLFSSDSRRRASFRVLACTCKPSSMKCPFTSLAHLPSVASFSVWFTVERSLLTCRNTPIAALWPFYRRTCLVRVSLSHTRPQPFRSLAPTD